METPVDYFLMLANKLPGPLAPFIDQWDALCWKAVDQISPSLQNEIKAFLQHHKSSHAASLPLMNPFHVILIILVYLVVIFFGVIFMKAFNRFNLKLYSILHNLFLVSLSGYMVYEVLNQAFVVGNYTFWGNNFDATEKGFPMAKIIWLFYISKIFEFNDTFIMVLKKNNRQISFLHLYHHVTIFAIWWLVTYMAPGGEAYYSAALNSFIHVVMYAYYLGSSLNFKFVSFIKKYITLMQMTQFVTMMAQAGYDLLYGANGYPVLPTRILFFYMITLLALFLNFFIRDRKRIARERAEAKKTESKKKN